MYGPLFVKTNNSLLSSTIRVDELIKFAKEKDIKALSITDDNMYGVMEFYKKCKTNNIKPIIGLNIFNIVLYCKNYNGYQNLIKLSTILSEREVDINDLDKYSSELVCIVPYNYINLYDELKKIYSDIYIGYKNDQEKNKIENKKVYMNEILYIYKEEFEYLKYLVAIKENKKYDEIEIDDSNYLRVNKDSEQIISKCNLEFDYNEYLLPDFETEENNSYKYLKKLCIQGLKDKFGQTAPKIYIDRLKYELEIIDKMGFCNYFLIVWDFVKFAKSKNILVGPGRGSAAGSLVSYCLNITSIDPIKYNLIFERFLNPERISMPDIDIDFEDKRRNEVIEYCIEKYGKKRVVPIIAFDTFGSRQSIRDTGRVMGLDITVIDNLCKYVDSKISLKENYNSNKKLREYLKNDDDLSKLYKVASKLEGLKRHTTIHAAGVIIGNQDLDEIIPLVKRNGIYLTGYSMEYLEEIGLLKIDFLAISNLSTINNILKEIKTLSFDNIPLNDKATLELFKNAKTIGIFQFESSGMINFLKKMQPSTFEDIFAAIALFRPGPMKNIDSYINRKNAKEKIDYIHSSLKNILENTNGIIIYQEQIMQIANTMANYSLGEADVLRKAMSKKKEDILIKEKEKFVSRSIKNGYEEKIAVKVYNMILKFASYGFNRAHSVGYAMVAYKMAYLKVHYPLIFSKYLLDMYQTNEGKMQNYIYECKENKINILNPCVNMSKVGFSVENNSIRCPLNIIKGISKNISQEIYECKKNSYSSIYEFMGKTYGKGLNKKILENLILAGALDSFGYNRKTLYENLDVLMNFAELASSIDEEFAIKPEIEIKEEYSKKQILKKELELFGFYLSNHPVTEYKTKYNSISLIDIEKYFDKNVNLILLVHNLKVINTSNNKKMMFITGSDELNNIDLVIFPDLYETLDLDLKVGNIIFVKGKCEKRNGRFQIIINAIEIVQ